MFWLNLLMDDHQPLQVPLIGVNFHHLATRKKDSLKSIQDIWGKKGPKSPYFEGKKKN
jgi:hypothetical protein